MENASSACMISRMVIPAHSLWTQQPGLNQAQEWFLVKSILHFPLIPYHLASNIFPFFFSCWPLSQNSQTIAQSVFSPKLARPKNWFPSFPKLCEKCMNPGKTQQNSLVHEATQWLARPTTVTSTKQGGGEGKVTTVRLTSSVVWRKNHMKIIQSQAHSYKLYLHHSKGKIQWNLTSWGEKEKKSTTGNVAVNRLLLLMVASSDLK